MWVYCDSLVQLFGLNNPVLTCSDAEMFKQDYLLSMHPHDILLLTNWALVMPYGVIHLDRSALALLMACHPFGVMLSLNQKLVYRQINS